MEPCLLLFALIVWKLLAGGESGFVVLAGRNAWHGDRAISIWGAEKKIRQLHATLDAFEIYQRLRTRSLLHCAAITALTL